jgi:Uma2 family endonuclease
MSLTLDRNRTVAHTRNGIAFVKGATPLKNGQRLTQKEFHRRYEAWPHKRAELIEGIVYMSPPPYYEHGRPQYVLAGWLLAYEFATPGLKGVSDTTVILDEKNEVQPDLMLRIGSAPKVREHFYTAPALAVEIANTSIKLDLGIKKDVYRRHGVREYIVYGVAQSAVHWFALKDGEYVQLEADEQGIVRSQIFPGLWLNTRALAEDNTADLFKTLNAGLASPEHAAFLQGMRVASGNVPKRKPR